MKKKVVFVFSLIIFSFGFCGYTQPNTYIIDAEKNAISHNNLGLKALFELNYYAAIQEFNMAIALNSNTQATGVYYNNLGEVYMKMNCFKEAQNCFENAVKLNNLNFLYYQNLIKSYKAQGQIATKIRYYKSVENSNSLNMMLLGLLYVAGGHKTLGIIKLD